MQMMRQWDRWWIVGVVVVVVVQINMDFVVKEGFDSQYYCFSVEFEVYLGDGVYDVIVFDNQIFNCLLEDYQVWLVFQCGMYCLMIKYVVSLGVGGVYCWFFVGVQYFKLNICLIDCFGY